jgi:hypothetical protein
MSSRIPVNGVKTLCVRYIKSPWSRAELGHTMYVTVYYPRIKYVYLSAGWREYNILPDTPWCLPQASHYYEPDAWGCCSVYTSIKGAIGDEPVRGYDESMCLTFFRCLSEVCSQKCFQGRHISPFVAAAWTHAAFARIHPFTASVLWIYFNKLHWER